MTQPHLTLTLGDPAGIGPEIVLKALADERLKDYCQITVIGSRSVLESTYQQLHSLTELVSPDQISIWDVPLSAKDDLKTGMGNAATGKASFAYLNTAIEQTIAGNFDGIVTSPIAKSCWQLAGHDYPGQTEVLAQATDRDQFGMLFVARSPHTGWTLRTLLATTHIPLQQVSQTLTPALMTQKLDLLIETLQENFDIKQPQIAIAGLNPHSGENGQFGTEEQDWLFSWLEQAQTTYPDVKLIGLVPPDTLWVKAGLAWFQDQSQSPIDAYLALYHDQGLIPVKLMAFDQAINTTIGLPFIRTSPDHGTAFDIAGKGIARCDSLKAAIELAAQLTGTKS
ncbi:4-hydroxythreonine-4-phosphate dehydrogenase PdxA [Dactylococcopsis salina]|uniref:4-hydroxythreonine-4-phosphate dehydrogenase n=1 Tax=Dactylococcopsis salina (strain PCC 8305) TaxID=13035 RepID=K9YU85_DACS8|nr:4-hydroxythreonine-4-phosphate dehydrogenase PdxA [Dactylococcopsis salina]AFZ50486.1 4-hydroxythreonine-4-phosphate dehydrogenase [Dactylococcopsis salina PCC 8305]